MAWIAVNFEWSNIRVRFASIRRLCCAFCIVLEYGLNGPNHVAFFINSSSYAGRYTTTQWYEVTRSTYSPVITNTDWEFARSPSNARFQSENINGFVVMWQRSAQSIWDLRDLMESYALAQRDTHWHPRAVELRLTFYHYCVTWRRRVPLAQ